jgi:hypothetical protein
LEKALQKRIEYAEKHIRNLQNNSFERLSCKDLFGKVVSRQASLKASGKVIAQCHVLFDLPALLEGRKFSNVRTHR